MIEAAIAQWPFAPLTAGRYACVEADPTWRTKTWSKKGLSRAPERHYETMNLEDICTLPVAKLAAKDAWLFLWTTAPHLERAFQVMRAWGFRYSSTGFIWVKLNPRSAGALFMCDADFSIGQGFTTRKQAEICLLGRRGNPKRRSRAVREVIFAKRRVRSRKPDEAYRRITEFAAGPRCALFTREARPGFECWGAEADKFDREAA